MLLQIPWEKGEKRKIHPFSLHKDIQEHLGREPDVELNSHFILTTQQNPSAAATLRSHAHLLAPRYDLMLPERFHLQTQVKDIPFPGNSPTFYTMQIRSSHLHTMAISARPRIPTRISSLRIIKLNTQQRPGVWPRLTSIDSGNFPALITNA